MREWRSRKSSGAIACLDKGITILVVDVNPRTRDSMARILAGAGCNVIETGTKSDAIAESNLDRGALDDNFAEIDGDAVSAWFANGK